MIFHVLIFGQFQPVIQPVMPFSYPITMKNQRQIPIMNSVGKPEYAAKSVVAGFKSYRESVIWAWENRPCHGLREQDDQALCARYLGLHTPHMSRCVNPTSNAPMNLSPDLLAAFETYCGSRAPSQYIASKAQLNFLEQIMEERMAVTA